MTEDKRETEQASPVPGSWEALADAAAALAGELDLDAVLESVVKAAVRTTGARYAALGILGDDERITRFVSTGVDDETVRRIGHYPRGEGILGLLIREPKIIRLDDLTQHPDHYGFPPGHPPMTTFLGAPVRSSGRIYGNLYLTDKPGGFTEADEVIVMVLGAQAGAAVENALLSERLQSLAVQEERDRISRELHDGVIQSLFSIGMGLESVRALIATDPARAEQRLDAAVDAVDGTIRELRNYIFRLRPQEAASMGLARGLTELAREHEVNALVRPELAIQASIDARVPVELVPDLLQIAREALSNVAKHAHASSVSIRAWTRSGTVHLVVSDDGVGFSSAAPAVGRGLENMRERANLLGGELRVDSRPGLGTTLTLSVPFETSDRAVTGAASGEDRE
ncbi:MAG TPA: GAF domain-containing sensor histidine kinase [Egibacteraceae bacterium]